jgi:membrane-associated phospholipid phosphatase
VRAQPGDALGLTAADAVLAPSLVLAWGGLTLLPTPAHCRACDGPDDSGLPGSPGSGRGSLNGVDAAFHDALTGFVVSRKTGDTLSTVLAYGGAPALALGSALFAAGPRSSEGAWLRTSVIVLESAALSGVVAEGFKLAVARKRPFVRYGNGTNGPPGSTYDVNGGEGRLSFVSGHATAAAALGTSAALCATLEDSPAAKAVWAFAGAVVVLTGTLRMVAEQHYFTDVVGGVAIGAAAGTVVPLLHRRGVQMTGNGFAYAF